MSQAERDLRQKIEHKATVRQRQKSAEEAMKVDKSPPSPALTKQVSEPTMGASEATDGTGNGKVLPVQKKVVPQVKKIRVTTSDGRQVMICQITYVLLNQLM